MCSLYIPNYDIACIFVFQACMNMDWILTIQRERIISFRNMVLILTIQRYRNQLFWNIVRILTNQRAKIKMLWNMIIVLTNQRERIPLFWSMVFTCIPSFDMLQTSVILSSLAFPFFLIKWIVTQPSLEMDRRAFLVWWLTSLSRAAHRGGTPMDLEPAYW